MSKYQRGFHWTEKAWYHVEGRPQEVMFGLYADDGSASGEMAIRWHVPSTVWAEVGDARLEAFDDSWQVLGTFSDLLKELGKLKGRTPTPAEVVEILKSCDFEDMTEYEEPKQS